MSRLVILAALVAMTGCSLIAAERGGYTAPCERRYVAPIADSVGVAASIGAGIAVFAIDDESIESTKVGPVMLIPMILFGLSAYSGFKSEQACK